SIATSAINPHIFTLGNCDSAAVILHLSLRDLAPDVMLAVDNVVDDADHVTRANTSLDLAVRLNGGSALIQTTIGHILQGGDQPWRRNGRPVVFSPFGLGILDLAVAARVYESARMANVGTTIPAFHGIPG